MQRKYIIKRKGIDESNHVEIVSSSTPEFFEKYFYKYLSPKDRGTLQLEFSKDVVSVYDENNNHLFDSVVN